MGTRLMEDFISRSWINLRNSTLKELHDVVLKVLYHLLCLSGPRLCRIYSELTLTWQPLLQLSTKKEQSTW